ncbi:hypothetical protein 278BB001_19 [Bacillus phage 278BB001]|nr:hypothetical protein 043JT007_28 [Bacillus phage 043JT007]QZA70170.1 hypothetical protein 278BB001_19 [Bacillus phage 278BB001]
MTMTTDERTAIRNTLMDMVDLLRGLTNTNPTQAQEAYILLIADRLNQLSNSVKEPQPSNPREPEVLLSKINSLLNELR